MSKPIDREYVLAALCGLLIAQRNPDALIAAYDIRPAERKRATQVAIQYLLSRGQESPRVIVRYVRELAQTVSLLEDEIMGLAVEVLRGTIYDPEWDRAEEALKSIGLILEGRTITIRRTPAFGYTGAVCAWTPNKSSEEWPRGHNAIGDLVYLDFRDNDVDDERLPQAYRDLLRAIIGCLAHPRHK